MKTVKRKVRLVIDAYPLFSEYGEPVVSACKMARDGWVPTLPDDAVRSVVEVELTVPVMIEEEELPPAVAVEIARDEGRGNDNEDERQDRQTERVMNALTTPRG